MATGDALLLGFEATQESVAAPAAAAAAQSLAGAGAPGQPASILRNPGGATQRPGVPDVADAALDLETLDPAVLRWIELGVDGPGGRVSPTVWHAAFAVGMFGGCWTGVALFPLVDPSLSVSGGWMAVVCLVTLQFSPVCRGLRPQLREADGLLSKLLRARVSPAVARGARKTTRTLRGLQVFFVVGHWCTYSYGLLTLDIWSPDLVIGVLTFMIGYAVGSCLLVASLLTLTMSTDVLRDQSRRLATRVQAAAVPSEQEVDALALGARELGQDVAHAHRMLHPVMLNVILWAQAFTALFLIIGIGADIYTDATSRLYHIGTGVLAGLLGIFGVVRGPFRVTEQIDLVNEALLLLRERRRQAEQQQMLALLHEDHQAVERRPGGEAAAAAGDGREGRGDEQAMMMAETPTVRCPSRVQWLTTFSGGSEDDDSEEVFVETIPP